MLPPPHGYHRVPLYFNSRLGQNTVIGGQSNRVLGGGRMLDRACSHSIYLIYQEQTNLRKQSKLSRRDKV